MRSWNKQLPERRVRNAQRSCAPFATELLVIIQRETSRRNGSLMFYSIEVSIDRFASRDRLFNEFTFERLFLKDKKFRLLTMTGLFDI